MADFGYIYFCDGFSEVLNSLIAFGNAIYTKFEGKQ